MTKQVKEGRPGLLVFREILPGDIRKQLASSNDASTGGGARDLRFRQAAKMSPILSRMFPHSATTRGVIRGPVRWFTPSGLQEEATIELWRPTSARPGEVRLGQINLIRGWEVDANEYELSRKRGNSWFYFLVLDSNRTVWARLFRQEDLDGELALVRDYILKRQGLKKNAMVASFGSIDFVKQLTEP